MQRILFSLALAALSLLAAYAIVAKWPDATAPAEAGVSFAPPNAIVAGVVD